MSGEPAGSVKDLEPPLLELRGITKTYGRQCAVDHVDFHIGRHEVVGLLGDNGAGKSSLVKIISGIVAADEGRIYSEGRPVRLRSHRDASQLGIETIYQDIALVNSMSVMRNMFLGRELTNALGFLDKGRMRRQAMEMLGEGIAVTGIRSPDQWVGDLSGGQKQAVAIGRAVYFKKRILLLDEPTSALSVRETEKLLAHIEQLRGEGISSVFVTHNLYHAYRVCDRFVVLAHGRKILDRPKSGIALEELTRHIVNS